MECWKEEMAKSCDALFKRMWTTPKSEWGEGAWQNEPDYEFFEYQDHKIMIRRGPVGSFNGYAEVKEGHPWFATDYNDIDIDVHQGLTFGGILEDGLFYIGFDTAHYQDYCPIMEFHAKQFKENYGIYSSSFIVKENYKDIDFVRRECISMVDQIIKSKNPKED